MPGAYIAARKIIFQSPLISGERCGMNRCKNRANIRKFRREHRQLVRQASIITYADKMKPGKETTMVIGDGGFASLYAAKQLDATVAPQSGIEVALVSRKNSILFTPMAHEVAAGDLWRGDVMHPFRRIFWSTTTQ